MVCVNGPADHLDLGQARHELHSLVAQRGMTAGLSLEQDLR
jgi:hypothetical protein